MNKHNIALIGLLFLPLTIYAAPQDFKSLVAFLLELINLIVPIIFGLTLVVFLWGLTKTLVLHGGDETEIERGKSIVLWGVVGLVVMVGIWGIIALLRSALTG